MKKHITVRLSLVIGLLEIVAMVVLFLVLNYYLTDTLEDKVVSDMNVISQDRAQLVETYIKGCTDFVSEYSHIAEVRDVLKKPTDKEAIRKARSITTEISNGRDDIEGLYVAQWDTYVLAHLNPDSVDKTFRDKESAAQLEEQIRKAGKAFCTGIVQAPVTKKMVIPIYSPVKDENGELIGFVGGAFFADRLKEELESFEDNDDTDVGYSLVNIATETYIFDDDESMLGKTCEDENILSAIRYYHTEIGRNNHFSYTTSDIVASCYYMSNRDWILVVRDVSQDVYGIIGIVRVALIIICVATTVLIIVVFALSAKRLMTPVRSITDQIERLRAGDYSHGHSIEKYSERADEFGLIAHAVDELHSVLEHQYELFLEILKAQTVGTLVTTTDDRQVVLINDKAMELLNVAGKAAPITIQDIRGELEVEMLEIIDKNIERVKSEGELSYEISIAVGANRRHMLVNIKRVILSNGDDVIIRSLTDITDRKQLEENLKVLSETDPLTRICNRRSGEAQIRALMDSGRYGMFCLFDVDKFKHVNDTYGHGVGDQVLMRISDAMKRSFRTSDVLIRLGGDEFVVFAVSMPDEKTGRMVIERFLDHVNDIEIEELGDEHIHISLGAYLVGCEEAFEEMYAKADSVMYDVKSEEGSAYRFYHSEKEMQ